MTIFINIHSSLQIQVLISTDSTPLQAACWARSVRALITNLSAYRKAAFVVPPSLPLSVQAKGKVILHLCFILHKCWGWGVKEWKHQTIHISNSTKKIVDECDKTFFKKKIWRDLELLLYINNLKNLKFKCSNSEHLQVQLRSLRTTCRNLLLWAHSVPELGQQYSCISTAPNPWVLSSVWSKLTLQWQSLSPHQVVRNTCASRETPVMPDWAEIQMNLSQVLCG